MLKWQNFVKNYICQIRIVGKRKNFSREVGLMGRVIWRTLFTLSCFGSLLYLFHSFVHVTLILISNNLGRERENEFVPRITRPVRGHHSHLTTQLSPSAWFSKTNRDLKFFDTLSTRQPNLSNRSSGRIVLTLTTRGIWKSESKSRSQVIKFQANSKRQNGKCCE